MRHLFSAVALLMAAACQSPGYDYASRAAPNYPEALDYTDVAIGQFTGPAAYEAQGAFEALIDRTEIGGVRWFSMPGHTAPKGIYYGDVSIDSYRRQTSFLRDRRCVKPKGFSGCDLYVVVELHCPKDIVDVSIRITLTDLRSQQTVFTTSRGGAAEHETCHDVAEYPYTQQSTGQFGDVQEETLAPGYAPIGLVTEAALAAIPGFREDIAPYITTRRAEIVEKPLTVEEANDPRFAAAVQATRRGEPVGACAQWRELAGLYSRAPAILHNHAACLEARGDLQSAHLIYAEAAEIARAIPLLKDKDAKPIFEALARISQGRHEETLIERAQNGLPD